MSEQQGPFDLRELEDTICVVTGAGNGGIGYGMLEIAATYKMHLACLDLHQSVCDNAVRKLLKTCPRGTNAVGIECDVTKPSSIKHAADKILEAFPNKRIGAVFANAGVLLNQKAKGIMDSNLDDFKATFNVNVFGVVNTIKAFVPLLQQSDKGSIMCNTASIGGLMKGTPDLADYVSSKHAVVCLSEALSFELAKDFPQIRVCICCPCIVSTGLNATSSMNQNAERKGERLTDPVDLSSLQGAGAFGYGLTPYNHAQQVFDRIAAVSKKYCIYLLKIYIRVYIIYSG